MVVIFFIVRNEYPKYGPYDLLEKRNDKVGILFEKVLGDEKLRIENKSYLGIKPEATKRISDFFYDIKQISTYASKGTESSHKYNKLEVRIVFKDGTQADKIYTGTRVMQAFGLGAQLLVKMKLEDGKVVETYTNGVELASVPEAITNDLIRIRDTVLRYDRSDKNRSFYYYAEKTKTEIEEDWKNLK
jgi:hypothetical protein